MRVKRISLALAWSFLLLALPLEPAAASMAGDANQASGLLDPFTAALIVNDDFFSTQNLSLAMTDPGTYHSPGFPSKTTDSGTCGPDWAQDQVTRYFTVRQLTPTTWSVYEQFKDGSFLAPPSGAGAEASPGACAGADGGVIVGPVTGSFHGYLVMTITATSFNPSAADNGCPPASSGGCTFTGQWLLAAFGPNSRTDDAFFFHYVAASQGLALNEWKNASCNRGGNSGDIATTATSKPSYTCP